VCWTSAAPPSPLADMCCRWLGVPALSECLVEELDPVTSELTQLDAIGTVQLSQLRALLSSPAFAAAAFSIAAAHATAVPALRQLDLGSVSRLCAAAGQGGRLRFVQKLATKVVLRGSKEDVTRDSARRQVGTASCLVRGFSAASCLLSLLQDHLQCS
jgi:hypothetical protein